MGSVTDFDLAQLFDAAKSLADGAMTIPGYQAGGWNYRLYASSGFVDPHKPIREYTEQERHDFLYHEPVRMKIEGINMTYEGLVLRIQGSYLAKDVEAMQPHIRAFVERAVTFTTCPECGGTRLSAGARSSKIAGLSIADACSMQIDDLADGSAASTSRPSHRCSRRSDSTSIRSSRSGSATSAWIAPRAPFRAAKPSGPRWSATWARR